MVFIYTNLASPALNINGYLEGFLSLDIQCGIISTAIFMNFSALAQD